MHLSRRLTCTIVIIRFPSSVIGPSLTTPLQPLSQIQWILSGCKYSTSSTKFVFFCADQKTKVIDLASDWLRHFRLLLCNCRTEFKETWQEASTQCPLPNLCFSRLIRKPRWPPWPLIDWDMFDLYAIAEWNSIKLEKISRSSIRFVFFIPIRKPKCPPP